MLRHGCLPITRVATETGDDLLLPACKAGCNSHGHAREDRRQEPEVTLFNCAFCVGTCVHVQCVTCYVGIDSQVNGKLSELMSVISV